MSERRANVSAAGKRLLRRGAQGVRRTVARRPRLFVYLAILGPGVITANAGNDAGGIATFASLGADHGYTLLWILIPLTISLGLVQEMCARMGAITGKGLADLIRERFGVRWTALVMLALLIANGGVTVSEFNHLLPQVVLTLAEQLRQTLPPVFRQKNFDRVVYGHDSEYLAALINNRKRQQIIFGDLLRDLGRVIIRVRDLQIAAHHIFKRRRRVGENQTAQRNHADQSP